MPSTPLVSVGVPVYNGAAYLDGALRALRSQTLTDLEIIVSDNASTDASPDIAHAHASEDARVYVHLEPENRGAAWNFNNTFALATGRYFTWAAHDDVCLPAYLERCVELLERDPEVVWCHARMTDVAPGQTSVDPAAIDSGDFLSYVDGTPMQRVERAVAPGHPKASRASASPVDRFAAVLYETVADGNWDVFGVARREVMARTGLQRPVYGADKAYVAELALHGRYAEVPEILFAGRVHAGGSGALATAEEQRRWIDMSSDNGALRDRFALLRAYVSAIRHAPIDVVARAQCVALLARYVLQPSKVTRVVSTVRSQQGAGGGYLPLLDEEGKAAPGSPTAPTSRPSSVGVHALEQRQDPDQPDDHRNPDGHDDGERSERRSQQARSDRVDGCVLDQHPCQRSLTPGGDELDPEDHGRGLHRADRDHGEQEPVLLEGDREQRYERVERPLGTERHGIDATQPQDGRNVEPRCSNRRAAVRRLRGANGFGAQHGAESVPDDHDGAG